MLGMAFAAACVVMLVFTRAGSNNPLKNGFLQSPWPILTVLGCAVPGALLLGLSFWFGRLVERDKKRGINQSDSVGSEQDCLIVGILCVATAAVFVVDLCCNQVIYWLG
jgi:hypothetical protein